MKFTLAEQVHAFWSKARCYLSTQCWEWQGARTWRGYGAAFYRGRQQPASRVAYQMTHGPIPAGLSVLHSCDNPPCINPAHLHLGTQHDNSREMREKGRSLIGERHHQAQLTAAQVLEIRRRRAQGEQGRRLAVEFHVTAATICDIHLRHSWTHLP